MSKTKVLFVGSFKKHAKDGAVGGQMYACNTLIGSELKLDYDWVLLDSTSRSVPPPPFYIRLFFALIRVFKSIYFLLFGSIDTVLIFTGAGFGFMEKGLIALLSSLLNKKVVLAPRSGHLIEEIKRNSRMSSFILYVFDKCDVVICQSSSWKDFFSTQKNYELTEFVIVENWIDTDLYKVQKTLSEEVIILFMGWLEEKKGVFDLMNVILGLNGQLDSNILFKFAGDGGERKQLQEFIETNELTNRVELLGWVLAEDKKRLFTKTDIMVLPSYVEGYPNVLLEAMASQIAVIGTNVGGIPDLLQNGKVGLVVSPGNIKELANSILFFTQNKSNIEKYAKRGRERVVRGNDISVAIRKFHKILKISA